MNTSSQTVLKRLGTVLVTTYPPQPPLDRHQHRTLPYPQRRQIAIITANLVTKFHLNRHLRRLLALVVEVGVAPAVVVGGEPPRRRGHRLTTNTDPLAD